MLELNNGGQNLDLCNGLETGSLELSSGIDNEKFSESEHTFSGRRCKQWRNRVWQMNFPRSISVSQPWDGKIRIDFALPASLDTSHQLICGIDPVRSS